MVLATHFIDENIISEYRKMKNTSNVDAILAIDNTNCHIEFDNRVEERNFFDTNCKCFFFDSNLNDEFQLLYFIEDGTMNFKRTTLHNGDYRFYYIRKFFPNYDFYWIVEYDVFCNAETYTGFLEKFIDNNADLLIQSLRDSKKSDEGFLKNLDWMYNDDDKIYIGLFAVVRLSARAIDFLYSKRLEQREIFQNSTAPFKQWVFCEVFVPTTLINSDFICENLNEPHVKFLPHIYLNDERVFLKPDNHLYHPVKSVSAEVSKMKKQYADLFFCFRKNFLIHLAEKLTSISTLNIKDCPIQFDENFNSMAIDLTGGGLRCEIWFLKDKLYGAVDKLYVAVVFEGEYLEYFKIIAQYIDFRQNQSIQILQSPTCKMLAYNTTTYDNVSQVANVVKILIEMTFTILQEQIYENN